MDITIMKWQERTSLDTRGYFELLLKNEYTDEKGIGFKELIIEENNSISGLVVKKTPVFFKTFDKETNTLVDTEQILIDEIDFVLDVKNKLIEINAPAKNVKKVITVFLNTVDNEIKIETIVLKPSSILETINEDMDSCEIKKIHIKNFSSEKGVIGSYDVKSVENNLAWELVSKYKNEIVRATIFVLDDNTESMIQIFQNGKFKIATKPKNNSSLVVNRIKNLISKHLQ